MGIGTVITSHEPVGILWEFLNGCEVKRKRVKYAIKCRSQCLNFAIYSPIFNLCHWQFSCIIITECIATPFSVQHKFHRHRHSVISSRPGSDTARRASLAWRPWSGVLQAGSDSSSVSERPRSTVPVGLLQCPGHRCWHSATAAFQQPSTSCSTTLPAQYLWLPGLFSCRPHSLVFSPGFYLGPTRCLLKTYLFAWY